MKTENAGGRLEGVGLVLVSVFIGISIALAAVSIWAIVRLVLHYT